MRCSDFENRMQRLLDKRRRPELDGELIAHAQVCGNCEDVLSSQALLFDGLEYSELPAPSDDFSPRTVAHAQVASRTNTRRANSRLVPIMLLSAAALFLIALLPISRQFAQPRPGHDVAVVTPHDVAVDAAPLVASDEAVVTDSVLALSDIRLGLPDSQRIAMGLRPLTYTFSFAFDALHRTFVAPFTDYETPGAQGVDRVISLIL